MLDVCGVPGFVVSVCSVPEITLTDQVVSGPL